MQYHEYVKNIYTPCLLPYVQTRAAAKNWEAFQTPSWKTGSI